jgi:hypothetical protein
MTPREASKYLLLACNSQKRETFTNMHGTRNTDASLVGKCGNRWLTRPKQGWKVIKMDLQEMSYENTNWFWMRFDEELWLRRFLRRFS